MARLVTPIYCKCTNGTLKFGSELLIITWFFCCKLPFSFWNLYYVSTFSPNCVTDSYNPFSGTPGKRAILLLFMLGGILSTYTLRTTHHTSIGIGQSRHWAPLARSRLAECGRVCDGFPSSPTTDVLSLTFDSAQILNHLYTRTYQIMEWVRHKKKHF